MRKLITALGSALMVLMVASPTLAHVTIQPEEAPAAAFFRFVVRVPNERDDANTIKVEVQFPETLAFVSFQPKDGWERGVTMKTLDEPIEVFGNEITEVIDTVTWEAAGPPIRPGEFDEFGFSARVPEEEGEVAFPSIQTYSSGEVVQWIGPPDSDEPAPIVQVVNLGTEEGEGELSVLARLNQSGGEAAGAGGDEAQVAGRQATDGEGTSPITWAALIVAVLALAASIFALTKAGARRSA